MACLTVEYSYSTHVAIELTSCYSIYRLVMEQEIVGHKILIIQCDCGHLHSNLIACARHKVIDEIVVPQTSTKEDKCEDNNKAKNESASKKIRHSTVHVVFIVQLPRKAGGTNFVGFQGGDWLSVHLDDLRPLKENELSFQSAIQCSISEIFNSMYQSVTSAASEIKFEPGPSGQDTMSLSYEQKVGSSTDEQNVEFSNNEQNVEPSINEQRVELSANEEKVASSTDEKELECSQNQSLSFDASHTLDITRNRFQSVSFNANRRLRDLIQMACSWLYDTEQNRERTTERISILTDLIPTESTRG